MSEDVKKKKDKKKTTSKILSCPRDQQIDEVAVGMLREYMHKRGYKETLSVFDTEMPRSDVTIQSRQLMMDLLHYGSPCDSSIIEFVCKNRVNKQRLKKEISKLDAEVQALEQEAKTLGEEVAPLRKTLKKLKKKTEQTQEKVAKQTSASSKKKKSHPSERPLKN
eukprot:TRINITY_DN5947_c0_g1_i3.p2 TRINITY_DN5947_c0_g1~~TRINITY_DN5947_c0_g1_i3.p2  ORF type:complete len:165 (+),score=35.19 TRINITY_DN5947_c0_g1_i3:109-603(+)